MQINLIEYLVERFVNYPFRPAVIEGEKIITFEELNQKAIGFGTLLANVCQCQNTPIAVYLPKSIEAVVSDISITYSGNIYMNLDVKTPAERIGNIVTMVEPSAIITTPSLFENIKNVISENIKIIYTDAIVEGTNTEQEFLLERLSNLIDTDPYCIINTSGSTGTPKSVVLNHRSFIDFTEWSTETLKIGDNEIIGSLSPLVFDIYSYELCMMMTKGSTIVLLPEHLSAFPIKILEILVAKKITYLFWVPTIMVNIANMDLFHSLTLPDLKTVWFAGEVLPTKQYNYWHQHLPQVKFVNLYGPIEITLDCTYYIVDREFDDSEPLPIGFACRNTSILILDENDKSCEIGSEGELCIRGTSLAMGYYNNPEKTALAFTQNPLNLKYPELIYRTGDMVAINARGEILFKGRRDTLVKHSGYRIELGEIEHVIVNTLKLVPNACVLYNHKNKEIVLVYESVVDISVMDFRKAIGSNLPKYMIPTKFSRVDKMPMNMNGKIDRLTLKEQFNENH